MGFTIKEEYMQIAHILKEVKKTIQKITGIRVYKRRAIMMSRLLWWQCDFLNSTEEERQYLTGVRYMAFSRENALSIAEIYKTSLNNFEEYNIDDYVLYQVPKEILDFYDFDSDKEFQDFMDCKDVNY